MRHLIYLCFFIVFKISVAQTENHRAIEKTRLNYVEGFYEGDTLKLKAALKPKLYKFGYWKNKDTGIYEFSSQMTYQKALDYANKVRNNKSQKDENAIRKIEVLDVGHHIAAAKVTAWWGIDYMLLSKDNGQWMIEQVIWEGPLEKSHVEKQ